MRLLFTLVGWSITVLCLGQAPPKSLRIQVSYEKAGRYVEQAVDLIEATNKVEASTNVEYAAGKSVSLFPGFEAKVGSLFTAEIRPISSSEEVSLRLNIFPNPFEESTTIDYYLPADGKVNLWVTDLKGNIVGKIVENESQSAGSHQIQWKPTSLNAGVYVPVIETNQQKAISRVIKK